ncbi:MAG: hypothetical protein JWR05_3686 [Mucilaginibacter sp.]|jgi:hypothetical protein|nr:hypothetical protein [Mucilaginibacter sp.]
MTSPDEAVWTALQLVHLEVLSDDVSAAVGFINRIDDPGRLRQIAVVLLELVGHVFEQYVPPEQHEARINELIALHTPDTPDAL